MHGGGSEILSHAIVSGFTWRLVIERPGEQQADTLHRVHIPWHRDFMVINHGRQALAHRMFIHAITRCVYQARDKSAF